MSMIDLRSDTVTKPSTGMLTAMMNAEVGDDVFREDPTVNALEEMLADIFHKEAALFFPSGTMANQVAIKMHTEPLDEMICTADAHVYQYEGAGYAFHSGIGVNPIPTVDGLLRADQIEAAIKPRQDWLPISKLVTIENSSNRTGGNIYSLPQMSAISTLCKKHDLRFHIDGARIFNALIAGSYSAEDIGRNCDSISVCLSKGLGAPIGSVLISDSYNIRKARRLRKIYGGGMRQVGILAAAGIYALKNNIDRLAEDHRRAFKLVETIKELDYIHSQRKVETNILVFELIPRLSADEFIRILEEKGIRASKFGERTVRFTTHLDIDDKDITYVINTLRELHFPAA